MHLLHRADGDAVVVSDALLGKVANEDAARLERKVKLLAVDLRMLGKDEVGFGVGQGKAELFLFTWA